MGRQYQVFIEPSAQRTIAHLDARLSQRIVARIELLADNPRPPGSLKLAGHNAYRIRIGDYRVIYAINDDRLVVLIVEIGHRREVYRDF